MPAILRNRLETLRTLAEATDGIAVLNNNDLDTGLKRISDDLSSYYLLGYYSTNGKLDGRFHNIKVRVKRSGVEVRARKGYRSATAAEVTAAKTAAAPPPVSGLARERDQRDLVARAHSSGFPSELERRAGARGRVTRGIDRVDRGGAAVRLWNGPLGRGERSIST